MPIKLAARKSDLARLQAIQVGEALLKRGHQVDYHFRESLGDQNQDDPLWKMPEKGVFTEDFRAGLIQGQWDAVVHSWKDLPTDLNHETMIAGTLERADLRDLLLFKKSHRKRSWGQQPLQIFSSSPRRIYNLQGFLKESLPFQVQSVEFQSVRGNILTRIKKLFQNEDVSALIVAKAAMDRLLRVQGDGFDEGKRELKELFSQCDWQVLPLSVNPTAAAQGALAIEIASSREDLKELFSSLSCAKTYEQVIEERALLKSYGGGCHQKIGVSCLSRSYGNLRFLKGETDEGLILDELKQSPLDLKKSRPLKKAAKLFERQRMEFQSPAGHRAHYITKDFAVPEGVSFKQEDLLWASGIQTWKKMAQRGYWVHGCSESLGEEEDLRIESLLMDAPLSWTKWTHASGFSKGQKQMCATYQLIPQKSDVDLSAYDQFYWMSGSQFQEAVRQFPGILASEHFCGPGHTFTMICEMLEQQGIRSKPTILASPKLWKRFCED